MKTNYRMEKADILKVMNSLTASQRAALKKKWGGRNITAFHRYPGTNCFQVVFDDTVAHDFSVSKRGAIEDVTSHALMHIKEEINSLETFQEDTEMNESFAEHDKVLRDHGFRQLKGHRNPFKKIYAHYQLGHAYVHHDTNGTETNFSFRTHKNPGDLNRHISAEKRDVKEGFHTRPGPDGKPITMYVPQKADQRKEEAAERMKKAKASGAFGKTVSRLANSVKEEKMIETKDTSPHTAFARAHKALAASSDRAHEEIRRNRNIVHAMSYKTDKYVHPVKMKHPDTGKLRTFYAEKPVKKGHEVHNIYNGGQTKLGIYEDTMEPRQSFRTFILDETIGTPEEEDLKFHEALHQAGYKSSGPVGKFSRKLVYTHPTRASVSVMKSGAGKPFALSGVKKFTRRSDLEKHLAAERMRAFARGDE